MVYTQRLHIPTEGHCHLVDITAQVQQAIDRSKIKQGVVTVFNVGSTAGITTLEYEPGLVNFDMKAVFENWPPKTPITNTKKPGTTTTDMPMSAPACWDRPWPCPSATAC
jgi:thiamine phosphate synthase YjbQ (UPF0047 family)